MLFTIKRPNWMDLLILPPLPPLQALELSLLETINNPVTLTTFNHTHCFNLKKILFHLFCVWWRKGDTHVTIKV